MVDWNCIMQAQMGTKRTPEQYNVAKFKKKSRNSQICSSQRRIYNLVKHSRGRLFAKTVNVFQPLTIYAEKLHRRCSAGSKYASEFSSFTYFLKLVFGNKVKEVFFLGKALISFSSFKCFNYISVNTNPISVRIKSKRQRINTVTFYLLDILIPLFGVVFKHIDQI